MFISKYLIDQLLINYWICITNEKNWDVIRENNVWGVTGRYMPILAEVEIGDKILFYIKGGKVKGIFEAVSKIFKSNEKIFDSNYIYRKNELFPHRINLKLISIDIQEVNIYDIIQKLKLTKDKENWGSCFFRSMIKINIQDYKVFERKMKISEKLFQ